MKTESILVSDLKKLLEEGHNISSYLKQKLKMNCNDEEIIEISYDLQAGSYIALLENTEFAQKKESYVNEMLEKLPSIEVNSVLEAGVGEATTLKSLTEKMKVKPKDIFGFDISWSRIHKASEWLKRSGDNSIKLCTGSLLEIPFADNSFDFVFTSHAVEPNGGREKEIIESLYRVTKKYLILFEPDYDAASIEGKARMDKLGYCKGLFDICKSLGYHIESHGKMEYAINKLNPTSFIIVSKKAISANAQIHYSCPKTNTRLQEYEDCFFSSDSLLAYPKIKGIPCLRSKNAIIASAFEEKLE